MKIIRQVIQKQEIETNDIQIGDQINIDLNLTDIFTDRFTATAQRITNNEIFFMFDDCVALTTMNDEDTNEDGYEESDLHKWLKTEFYRELPSGIRYRIKDIFIPTYGMVFGNDFSRPDDINPDKDIQFPLMRYRENRLSNFKDIHEWYWLQNTILNSDKDFAAVNSLGFSDYNKASTVSGVRPVLVLTKDDN